MYMWMCIRYPVQKLYQLRVVNARFMFYYVVVLVVCCLLAECLMSESRKLE